MHTEPSTQPIYGKNAVAELLKSDVAVDTVLLADTMDAGQASYFTALAKQAGAVVKRTRTEKLNTLCDGRHQGVAAIVAQISYCAPDDILAAAAQKGQAPFILLADSIEDPHNLGALLRTALLCGVHGAIIPKRGASPITPVVMKASAGAAALLPVARVSNLGDAIRRLKKAGVFIYCADMQGTPLQKQNLDGPVGIVMGAEGKGVSALTKKLCDGALALSMAPAGGVDSLNVSVAGGIIMYEIFQRRQPAAQ